MNHADSRLTTAHSLPGCWDRELKLAAAVTVALVTFACGGDEGASESSGATEHSSQDDDGANVDEQNNYVANASNTGTIPPQALPPLGDVVIDVPSVSSSEANDFLLGATTSKRVTLPLAAQGQVLVASQLSTQLQGYDPGSLIRCDLNNRDRYDASVDAIGGVAWGYSVVPLEDQSQPLLYAGFLDVVDTQAVSGAGGGTTSAAVEIVTSDVVAVTESAALFFSTVHGLLLVDLTQQTPTFQCATQLPGNVDQFFFHAGHLIAMTRGQWSGESHLLHFTVDGTEIDFTEDINLGAVNILDSRRFNDKLVFYTDHKLPGPEQLQATTDVSGMGLVPLPSSEPPALHRALRVYRLGDTLEEEMYDTLIDTTPSEAQLYGAIDRDTPIGTMVNESQRYGSNMWASDKYFVVTEGHSVTKLSGWGTNTWSVCTESHQSEVTYDHCWTEYETRPNPDYVEPDNSGGDRGCQGTTLSDCLVHVAKVSNKTIQVPVGKKCETRTYPTFVCDRYEMRSAEYPVFETKHDTRLFIYEYTDEAFIQVDSSVHEITTEDLQDESPDANVEFLGTSTDTFELAVSGNVQTLHFQNGYLYVISEGILQVYAMGGSSIIRTATLPVVNETLQSSLFTDAQLILSDFGWAGGDHSTLRVVDLSNPAFPITRAETNELPGGHRSILLSEHGIFTIGGVQQFMGQTVSALKLGLFSDPYVDETAYLVLGTDLTATQLGSVEAQLFNAAEQRLLLPYWGRSETLSYEQRVGVSRIEPDLIVSEGAVVVPEAVERVRALPTATPEYLTFAANSIEWLTPEGDEWKSDTVLEYLTPVAVYRRTEDDDYVELQRLANRCRLYFANAATINERSDGVYSEPFQCDSWPAAFDDKLLFGATGVEFDTDGTLRTLSEKEVSDIRAAIAHRPVCLLSTDLTFNTWVNPNALPQSPELWCMTAEKYQEVYARRLSGEEVMMPEPN